MFEQRWRYLFLAYLSRRLKVSYCDQSLSVVRPSVNLFFKQHLLSFPYDALFQNCTNGSAPPNRRTARALDKTLVQIQNNFTELSLMKPSTKNATKGPTELQIRNIFKRYLLNHWFKFHITSLECSPLCPLSKLHNWFCSTEQELPK